MTEKERASLYKSVFNTADGRRVLADILVKGFVFNALPYDYAERHEGARELALHIAKYIGYDPARFPELMTEIEQDA